MSSRTANRSVELDQTRTNDPVQTRPPATAGRRSRLIYLTLAWILVGCITAQVFLAGFSVFDDPARWAWHTNFGRMFMLLPLVMLIPAFTGRFSRRMRWLTAGLFGLLLLQSFFIHLADPLGTEVVAALHPVNALVIFWLALTLARHGDEIKYTATATPSP